MNETTKSTKPAVVLDDVSMTYYVRTNQTAEVNKKPGLLDRIRTASRAHEMTIPALKPLSRVFTVGESVGVIGTNGSGKSTLMKLVSGQLKPTTGRVMATSRPVMLGVGAALLPSLTGHENITLGCLAMGMPRKDVEERRKAILDLSGLEDAAHLPLRSYSSGMGARLQFAIATAVDPDILIIDEALNTGDAQFRDRTRERVDELRARAGCVIVVSHSLDTIREICTRVIWLEKGELVMDGDPDEVTGAYHTYAIHRGRQRVKSARLHLEAMQEGLRPVEVVWT